MAKHLDDPTIALVSEQVSLYQSSVGQWAALRATVEQAAVICERKGERFRWGDCIGGLSVAAALEGDISRSLALAVRLSEDAHQRGNVLQYQWGLELQALSALRQNQAARAIALMDEARDIMEHGNMAVSEIINDGYLAVAYLRQGNVQAARQSADRIAAHIAQGRPVSFWLFAAYSGAADVYLTLWEQSRSAGASADILMKRDIARVLYSGDVSFVLAGQYTGEAAGYTCSVLLVSRWRSKLTASVDVAIVRRYPLYLGVARWCACSGADRPIR